MAATATSAIQVIDRVHAERSSIVLGPISACQAAAKERPALLARPLWPPSRSAPSCIGKSVLAQSAPVAPTAPCDYAKSRIC
jgi:hypothetical protein